MLGDKMYTGESLGGGEGAIRNHLAVSGPGVPAGALDNTLLGLADILPTIAELASAKHTTHKPWSGSSFTHLLVTGRRSKSSLRLSSRLQFTLEVSADAQHCLQAIQLMTQTLPDLDSQG
jgi:hypothetical protein